MEPQAADVFACYLNDRDFQKRRSVVLKTLGELGPSVVERESGYQLTFKADDVSVQTLADFILYERKCCPFLTFDLHVSPEETTLTLSGKSGVKGFLADQLFSITSNDDGPRIFQI